MKGTLVITHGLFMKPIVMKPLAKMLRHYGWETLILGYPSRSIHLETFHKHLDNITSRRKQAPLHFLGHSLGGLMLKRYCEERDWRSDTKLITLGTPHQGAKIVTRLDHYRLSFLVGNARDFGLLPGEARFWHGNVALGTIAGNVDTGLLRMLGGQTDVERSDGIVLVDEAKIEGSCDHIELNASHTTLIYSRRVAYYINQFLDEGRFH